MKRTAEILYESEEKNHQNEPYFTVKRAQSYYIYGERAGKDSVAFILYRDGKFGLINESKPPLDERENKRVKMTTAFGGSFDMPGKNPEEITKVEVFEESGFDVPGHCINYIGKTLVSTQMNQYCHGYMIDCNGLNDKHKKRVVWLSHEELMKNNDWKSIWILAGYVFQY